MVKNIINCQVLKPEIILTCPLCSSNNFSEDKFASAILNLADIHRVSQCRQCGFRFLSPRPNQLEYQQAYGLGTGPLLELYPMRTAFYSEQADIRLEEYGRKLDRLRKAGAKEKLLEIGSSSGLFLNAARQRGFQVEGIEPNAEDRRLALERFGLSLRPGGVEDQEIVPGTFDVVFSSHVFEHLLDPVTVANMVTIWLRPGGLHFIEVPNQFDQLVMKVKKWTGRMSPVRREFLSIHHPMFFSPRTLRKLVESAGCTIVSVGQVHYKPGPIRGVLGDPRSNIIRFINRVGQSSPVIDVLARKE